MQKFNRWILVVVLVVAVVWGIVYFFEGGKKGKEITQQTGSSKVTSTTTKKSKAEICSYVLSHKLSKGSVKFDKPPRNIPDHWKNQFLINGNAALREFYLDGSAPSNYEVYTASKFQELINKAKNRQSNHYGDSTDHTLFKAIDDYPFEGLDVVIFGTLVPFYEAVAIARGARSVTTIEYNKIVIEHPQVTTYTVEEFYSMPTKPLFDVGFSISSFEHDGLARYGDPLDPAGDLKAMLRVRCTLKPNGILFVAVPTGKDALAFNAHRVYGQHRLTLLFEGWMILNSYNFGKKVMDGSIQVDHSIFVAMNEPFDKFEHYGQPSILEEVKKNL